MSEDLDTFLEIQKISKKFFDKIVQSAEFKSKGRPFEIILAEKDHHEEMGEGDIKVKFDNDSLIYSLKMIKQQH